MAPRFRDRTDAGHELAGPLQPFARSADAIVLGLPRGGVPVAHEIARELELPLDVVVVRKVGAPGQPELAMGAVASGGARVVNDDVRLSQSWINRMLKPVFASEYCLQNSALVGSSSFTPAMKNAPG